MTNLRRQVTPLSRPVRVVGPWEGSVLVVASAQIVPLLLRDLEARKLRAWHDSDEAHAVAYDALCKQGEALLMDIGQRLQMEIRALRGVDDLAPGYNDPDADPFTLSLGTVEDNKRAIEVGNSILAEIKLAVEAMANAETLEEIRGHAAQIALLLG